MTASTLTFLALLGVGGIVAAAYVMLLRRPPGSARSPRQAETQVNGPLSLRAVIDRLATVGDDESVLFDRTTGRFITLNDQLLADVEGSEPVEDLIDDTTPFTEEQLEDLRRKLRAKKLLPLPTKAETKEFQLRERFCSDLPDGEAKEEMQKVLRGQTGYRSFDGAVARLQIAGQWERFRDAGFSTVAVAWLKRHEIPFINDVAAADEPPQLRQAG